MKIDLDELERKARATRTGDPVIDGQWFSASYAAEAGADVTDSEFIATTTPPVVLALIARIRELEVAGAFLSEMARMGYREDVYRSREEFERRRLEFAAILEKGAVLS